MQLKREYVPGSRQRAVLVRYSDDEYAAVYEAAVDAQLATAAYVAEAALAAASGQGPPSASPLHQLAVEFMQARLEVRRAAAILEGAIAGLDVAADGSPSLAESVQRCAGAVSRLDTVAARIGKALQ